MGIGFPKAPARVECLARFDFRVGCCFVGACCFCFALSGVASLLILFGGSARFSDVDYPESFDDTDVALSSHLAFERNSIPLVGVLGASRPPVLFPVAFSFDGLLCCAMRVSFTGSPAASSMNIGCLGTFGFSISKKLKQGPVLRADLYAT